MASIGGGRPSTTMTTNMRGGMKRPRTVNGGEARAGSVVGGHRLPNLPRQQQHSPGRVQSLSESLSRMLDNGGMPPSHQGVGMGAGRMPHSVSQPGAASAPTLGMEVGSPISNLGLPSPGPYEDQITSLLNLHKQPVNLNADTATPANTDPAANHDIAPNDPGKRTVPTKERKRGILLGGGVSRGAGSALGLSGGARAGAGATGMMAVPGAVGGDGMVPARPQTHGGTELSRQSTFSIMEDYELKELDHMHRTAPQRGKEWSFLNDPADGGRAGSVENGRPHTMGHTVGHTISRNIQRLAGEAYHEPVLPVGGHSHHGEGNTSPHERGGSGGGVDDPTRRVHASRITNDVVERWCQSFDHEKQSVRDIDQRVST